ncbi:hypothetical protein [Actinobaculum massiliense]|uniref:hypothetical protein n=1 Tax=Actinobaculum massiliense TaxID=202789 RepID=UPI000AE99586|nr:hypothetical protein [Actinobaculum massiliense]
MKTYQALICLTLTGLAIMLALISGKAPAWLECVAIAVWVIAGAITTYRERTRK